MANDWNPMGLEGGRTSKVILRSLGNIKPDPHALKTLDRVARHQQDLRRVGIDFGSMASAAQDVQQVRDSVFRRVEADQARVANSRLATIGAAVKHASAVNVQSRGIASSVIHTAVKPPTFAPTTAERQAALGKVVSRSSLTRGIAAVVGATVSRDALDILGRYSDQVNRDAREHARLAFTNGAFEQQKLASILGYGASTRGLQQMFSEQNAASRLGTILAHQNNKLVEFSRGFGAFNTILANTINRAMPRLEITRKAMGGFFDFLNRIDLEALQKMARIREARRPRTRIASVALKAYEAMCMNRTRAADRFLKDRLQIEPNVYTQQALWKVLWAAFGRVNLEPVEWILLNEEEAAAYLYVAVTREAGRIKRDQEMPDRLWWPGRDMWTSTPVLEPEHKLEYMMKHTPSPADLVARRVDGARLLELLYREGTAEDREFVELLSNGHEVVDIAHIYGWQQAQRFTRKAQRWQDNRHLGG